MAGRLYVVAGELSGDAHGAGLLHALDHLRPGVEIRGAGGPDMAAIAGPGLRDWVEDAAVVGFWEVIKRYGWFRQRFDEMLDELRRFRPDVLLLIDYPGFNLRFAAAVREAFPETRIVHYICPQVWAWNRRRIPKIARTLDELLCLFPFEPPIFDGTDLQATFVGHPLVDELEQRRLPDARRDPDLIGLFPGSRGREIARLFPPMIETARLLAQDHPARHFEAPAASPRLAVEMRRMVAESHAREFIRITDGGSHSLMQRAGCGVIASGTATLEAAWFGLPYCLAYQVAWSTYALGRLLVRLEHIGLVNILAGEGVVREFIQDEATPANLAAELGRLLEDPAAREALVARLAETAALLGGPGAHERAAERVAHWLEHA